MGVARSARFLGPIGLALALVSSSACADLDDLDHALVAEQFGGGLVLDGATPRAELRIQACVEGLDGASEPVVELEISPWRVDGSAQVHAEVLGDADPVAYGLPDQRPPTPALVVEPVDACGEGVVVELQLAGAAAGSQAELAWVVIAHARSSDVALEQAELDLQIAVH